jgi:succinate dehydrogenase / fumarate reductase flavoprotein subunit
MEVINADLLVIGSGINGIAAAAQAISEGKHVTFIEKGPYCHGGVTGYSWDAFNSGMGMPKLEGQAGYLPDGNLMRKAWEFDPHPQKFVAMVNRGQSLPDRNEDGTLAWYAAPNMCQNLFFRREMDYLKIKSHMTVYDRTMITDIILSDGTCVGVMGIHLPTGNFRVFRAPATVLSTGGCTWIHGWFTVGACSHGSPDNTADVDVAAFRHGAGIGDSEYAQYDVESCDPPGLACSFGSVVCADAQEAHAIFDKDGKLVFASDDANVADRTYFCQVIGRVIGEEGRGTEHGGVLLTVGDSQIRYSNERNVDLLKRFGVDVRAETIEAVPEMYEHGGTPVVDENMMSEFPGLFCGRGAGTTGTQGGMMVHYNLIYGTYAGHCAAQYATKNPTVGDFDPMAVIAEYDRLCNIRTRKVDNAVAPYQIREAIQRATLKGLGVYRNADLMNEALAELERIRAEDMPKMAISDDSLIYNTQWKEAIETYNMLDIAEISIRASLAREETRGMYLRGDFPEKDDANFACMLVCYNRNGVLEIVKKELPSLV